MSTARSQPWKKRSKIPDTQILDAAEQYDDARRLLQRQPPGSGVLLTELNTAAVAIELFLKSLSSRVIFVDLPELNGYQVYAEPILKSHPLVKLFDGIPDDIRQRLELSYSTSTLVSGEPSLRELLAKCEGLFQESRYPFEAKSEIRKYFSLPLSELSNFLRVFIATLTPVERIEW